MHLLHPAGKGRTLSQMRGSMPGGCPKIRKPSGPGSEIRYILENKRVFILKEELNTQPKFYYFYGPKS